MAFFDINPMGGIAVGGGKFGGRNRGIYRGGMPVGGMPVGGMPVGGMPVGGMPVGGMMFAGMPMGGALPKKGDMGYAEFRERVDEARRASQASKDAWVLTRTAQLLQTGVSTKLAKRQADYEYKAEVDKIKSAKAKVTRDAKPKKARVPRAKKAELTAEELQAILERRDAIRGERKEATKRGVFTGLYDKQPLFNDYEQIRRRITDKRRGAEGSKYAGQRMPKEVLAKVAELLTANGFGVVDLHSGDLMGEGFWDDVWSGIKDVGSVALKVAPMLL